MGMCFTHRRRSDFDYVSMAASHSFVGLCSRGDEVSHISVAKMYHETFPVRGIYQTRMRNIDYPVRVIPFPEFSNKPRKQCRSERTKARIPETRAVSRQESLKYRTYQCFGLQSVGRVHAEVKEHQRRYGTGQSDRKPHEGLFHDAQVSKGTAHAVAPIPPSRTTPREPWMSVSVGGAITIAQDPEVSTMCQADIGG